MVLGTITLGLVDTSLVLGAVGGLLAAHYLHKMARGEEPPTPSLDHVVSANAEHQVAMGVGALVGASLLS